MTVRTSLSAQAVSIDLLGHHCSIPGTIKCIADRSVHLFVSHLVQPQSRVRIIFSEEYSVEGQVAFRNPSGDGYTIGVFFEGSGIQELRRETRVQVDNEPATITVLDGRSRDIIGARVLDISRSGLGLRVNRRVPAGTWVKVELPRMLIFGEVKHCSPASVEGYRLGLTTDTMIQRREEPAVEAIDVPCKPKGSSKILSLVKAWTQAIC